MVEGSVTRCIPPSDPVGVRGHAWFENHAAGGVNVSEEVFGSRLEGFDIGNNRVWKRRKGGCSLVAAFVVDRKAGKAFAWTDGNADFGEPINR